MNQNQTKRSSKQASKQASEQAKIATKDDVGTTGHSWDGIEELNNPLPRWWLWTFYATIVWALAYMVVYPALPLLKQATPGLFGYASRLTLEADIDRFELANAPLDSALITSDIADIQNNPELQHYAVTGGSAVFRTFCAQCHGSGAAGTTGYANLIDDDWLWGGSLPEIYQTIRHGVRAEDDADTRFSEMPAFGELLDASDIADVTHYVLSLSGSSHNPSLVNSGRRIFAENCADCHGETGQGNHELGAPNLSDAIWLYGGSQRDVYVTINDGRKGMMPAWQNRLSEAQLRQVAIYVHQLSGAE